jgi:hypothetical protein
LTKRPIAALETESEEDEPPITKKRVPAKKVPQKRAVVASETEFEQDTPVTKKVPKKRTIVAPVIESEQGKPLTTKKRGQAKKVPQKRAIAATVIESEQGEPPITKKRRVDKEKMVPETAPSNVRKVVLTLPKPVETTNNPEVCRIYFSIIYLQPLITAE